MTGKQWLGILCGAIIGVPCGQFLTAIECRVPDSYFWEVGALVGAVVGATTTRDQGDRWAWLSPVFAIIGAIIGRPLPDLRSGHPLQGALIGLVLALVLLTIRSVALRKRQLK